MKEGLETLKLMQINKTIFFSTLIAAIGGFLFGFDTAVISGTIGALQATFHLDEKSLGFTVAIALIGTTIGAIIAGKAADKIGRKPVLFLLGLLYFLSAIGCALAWNWNSLLFFRFIGGLAIGGSSVVSPMYIAEISPPGYRGRLVAIVQLNIVIGILAAFFSNYAIALLRLGEAEWRWMLGVEAVPAAIFLILIPTIPRSPRWLVANGKVLQAKKILIKLGIEECNVEEFIKEIQHSLSKEQAALKVPFFQMQYIRPILLAIAIAAFNQLSGINAILYYAPYIFEMAGAGKNIALIQTVIVGTVNLIVTLLAMLVIDKAGRRFLMLIGSIGYIISLGIITIVFAQYGTVVPPLVSKIILIAILIFIASHAFGQGAVIWVFISEIFPTEVRARGQALGSFVHWVMNSIISQLFPILTSITPALPFGIFTVMMVCQLIWVITMMPETKGIPLEKIHKVVV